MEVVEQRALDAGKMAGLPARAVRDHPVDADLDRARDEERDKRIGPDPQRKWPPGRRHEEAVDDDERADDLRRLARYDEFPARPGALPNGARVPGEIDRHVTG